MPYSDEHEREGAEGGGLHRVDAHVEVLGVHLGDEVGAGEHEALVAPLERRAAEVVGAEVAVLHPGAERTVEHEDALSERGEELRHGVQATWRLRGLPGGKAASAEGPSRLQAVPRWARRPRRTARSARAHSSLSPELSP